MLSVSVMSPAQYENLMLMQIACKLFLTCLRVISFRATKMISDALATPNALAMARPTPLDLSLMITIFSAAVTEGLLNETVG